MATDGDNFESVVKAHRSEAVAEFHEDATLMRRVQHALHVTPALVPLVVLVLSIAIFGVLLGAGNAAGGYVVTERMLEMFKPSDKKKS